MADVQVSFGANVSGALGGINEVTEALRGIRAPIDELAGGFRELAEVAGAAFVIDKLSEWVAEITEGAEKTEILAKVLNTTAENLQQFQAISFLAGGEANNLAQTALRLSRSLQEGINKPLSDAGQALQWAGINLAQLQVALAHPIDTIELLRQAWDRLANNPNRLAIVSYLAGGQRALTQLMPYLTATREELERLHQEEEGTHVVISDEENKKLAETWQNVHILDLAIQGFEKHTLLELKAPIDGAVNALTQLIEKFTELGSGSHLVEGFFNYIKTNLDEDKKLIQGIIDAITWLKTHDMFGRPINQAGKVIPLPPVPGGHGGEVVPLPPLPATAAPTPPSPTASIPTGLTGSASEIAAALAKAGASANAIAGILGNLQAESGLSPTAVGPGGSTGIAQWLGSRLEELKSTEGPAWDTLKGQIDFLVKELGGKFKTVFEAANKAGSAAEAAAIIYKGLEKPAKTDTTLPTRQQYATSVAEGQGLPAGGSPAPPNPEAGRIAAEEKAAQLEVQIRDAEYRQDYALAAKLLDQKRTLLQSEKESTASVIEEEGRLRQTAAQFQLRTDTEAFATAQRLDAQRLAQTKATLDAEVVQGTITKQQEIAQLEALTQAQYAALRQQLAQIIATDQLTLSERQSLDDKLAELDAALATKMADYQKQAADAASQEWRKVSDELASSLSGALTDVVTKTKTWGQAMADVFRSLFRDTLTSLFKSFFSNLLGGTPSAGGGGGGIGSGLFNSIFGSLFKGGLSGLIGGIGGSGGTNFSSGGDTGDTDMGGSAPGASGTGGILGGLLEKLIALFIPAVTITQPIAASAALTPVMEAQTAQIVTALAITNSGADPKPFGFSAGGIVPGFSLGGIIPAAAGGWALPSSFGTDRVLAALTPGEMVLPVGLSQRVQAGLGSPGGAGTVGATASGGSGGDTHLHFHGPVFDAAGVKRFMIQHKDALAAGVSAASRGFHPALAASRP